MIPRPKTQEAPFPADYEAAIEEIKKLRRQLTCQAELWAKRFEQAHLEKRSVLGSLKHALKELEDARKRPKRTPRREKREE